MPSHVPFTEQALRKQPCSATSGWERRDAKTSGIWACELETLTPLCINSREFQQQRGDWKDQAALPASSLRGMIRNVAEVLGAGCGRFYGAPDLPSALRPCDERGACLVCRVFGFVHANFSWQSRVRITDTKRAKVAWTTHNLNRRTVDFDYYDEDPAVARREGWAVFPSFEPGPLPSGNPSRDVGCIAPGARFPFRVEYTNLDDEEYAVLRFAVTLSHAGRGLDLTHKLGFAKALGLGSCRVRILLPKDPRPMGAEIDYYLSQPGLADFARLRTLANE